ncbi:MAG: hypothetical protein K0M45_08425 [Candidatus Paracaedibacteraceae bacterium]|nr:hypothetical protein [Candidatus Paracaedibacteraceae bacterium]
MVKKSEKSFEQIELFGSTKPQSFSSAPRPEVKKPFVPVHTMALDTAEVKNNFMYMMRILLNTHQRSLSNPTNQDLFIDTLLTEIKIKRGLADPHLAVRGSALKSLKK